MLDSLGQFNAAARGAHRPGALPCVWMSAGVINYRLCDREYECESCPLDTAIRGRGPRRRRAPTPAPDGGGNSCGGPAGRDEGR